MGLLGRLMGVDGGWGDEAIVRVVEGRLAARMVFLIVLCFEVFWWIVAFPWCFIHVIEHVSALHIVRLV